LATPNEQLLELLDRQEARVRKAFMRFLATVQSGPVVAQLTELLEANDVEGALRIVDSYFTRFANIIPDVIREVGGAAAAELAEALPEIATAIVFDPTNPRAAALAAESRARLIRGFSEQQHVATHQAIARGVGRGAGTQEIARSFRDSIGLTANQESYVDTYRQQLQSLDARALDRALRDRRYDGRVSTALERDRPLTQRQIDTMVARYRARALAARADTIARTEALTAYSQAREEALDQMIAQTRLNANRVVRVWHSTHDSRVREWHASMEGQEREPGDGFEDGLGNLVRYPGDPLAPAETRINCRCTLGFRVLPAA
jgi:hypothetical protein